jgi:hypothetical protein
MTPRTAERLVRLYPHCWRIRYGREYAALLEEHPCSFTILVNILWSAGKAHIQSAMSHQRIQSIAAGWIWSAWMLSILAGLILYGMVDDSPMVTAMVHSAIFAGSWKLIQAGCLLAAAAIAAAGFPILCSAVLAAMRERQRRSFLSLSIPVLSVLVLIAWIASVLIVTGGHWAASPWAVSFVRPDWPSEAIRWMTGAISTALMVTVCVTSAVSVSQIMRVGQFPELRISFSGLNLQIAPLSFAAALVPWAAAGMFLMLSGVVVWGISANALAFRATFGPLGLSGLTSWVLSTILFGIAAAMSAHATWRSRTLNADQ